MGHDIVQVANSAGDLEVCVEGEGLPLLALHGALGHAAMVRSQCPAGFRVASYDQRGHRSGPRGADPRRYSINDFVSDALTVLDALAAEEGEAWRRPTVLGNSMGCAVAMRLALDHTSRVSRLIAVGPAFGDRTIDARDDLIAIADGLDAFGIDGWVPRMRARMLGNGLPEAATAWLDDWRQDFDAASLAAAARSVADWVPFPDLDRLADLGLPVTVVGWPGDQLHPLALARRVAELAKTIVVDLPGVADVLADPSIVARRLEQLGAGTGV